MDESRADDFKTSFMILNWLHSGFQGAAHGLRYLDALRHPSFDPSALTKAEQAVAKVGRWGAAFAAGSLLVHREWETPETFEAMEAFDLMKRLRLDLLDQADDTASALERLAARPAPEDERFVIAQAARIACARDLFIRGYDDFAAANPGAGLPSPPEGAAADAARELAIAADLFAAADADVRDPTVRGRAVAAYASPIPATFRTQAHDLSVLLGYYSGPMKYRHAGVHPDEEPRWVAASVEPREAGYWVVFGFGPEETAAWRSEGFFQPAEAASWRDAGFIAAEAEAWVRASVPAETAARWRDAGYDAARAVPRIKAGASAPPRR